MASGANWLLGLSPGGQSPPEVIAAAAQMNIPAVAWQALLRAGLTVKIVPVLKRPGYDPPTAKVFETATGPAISVLSQIQRYTAAFANTFDDYQWSDATVSARLTEQAHAAAAYLTAELDPDVNNIDALVAQYVVKFREAVTPVAVTP